MKKLLQLKHWQLFLLLVGLPLLFETFGMAAAISAQNPTILFSYFPIIVAISALIFFGWFYALGTNLHKKLPDSVKMNLTRFKVFLFIPAVYILFFCSFILKVSNGQGFNPAMMLLIVPIHLFSMFCIFYCLNFNAKSLKAVELQRQVTFSDYAGEFFMIWIFPIGIWVLQPRINKMFDITILES